MSNSEDSFPDRLGRGRDLKNACANFTPAFAPAEPTLTPANFDLFLSSVETKNAQVGNSEAMYSTLAHERVEHVRTIKLRTTEALSYVESSSAWAMLVPAVKMPADKLRGISPRPPAPPAPPPPGSTTPAPSRNAGDQSYEDIMGHLTKFITALGQVPGYAPANANITMAKFGEMLSTLKGQNVGLSNLGQQTTLAQVQRQGLYYGQTGLRMKMKCIKKAVRSQYGSDSAQFQSVSGISF